MAEQIVHVSVIQPRRFRVNKTDDWTEYGTGLQPMPISHARGLGLTHRIRQVQGTGEAQTVVPDPFSGSFDAKVTSALNKAGYKTLDDVRAASLKDNFQDTMLAIDGIGPAAYERILVALQTGG